MRDLLLSVVSDADLEYALPGTNPTLGELLLEMGDVQDVYTRSLHTFVLDWAFPRAGSSTPVTVVELQRRFSELDSEMKAVLDRFSDEELQTPAIVRAEDFVASPFVQHEIYREAIYIYYGKLSVYLRALGRDAGPTWTEWIG